MARLIWIPFACCLLSAGGPHASQDEPKLALQVLLYEDNLLKFRLGTDHRPLYSKDGTVSLSASSAKTWTVRLGESDEAGMGLTKPQTFSIKKAIELTAITSTGARFVFKLDPGTLTKLAAGHGWLTSVRKPVAGLLLSNDPNGLVVRDGDEEYAGIVEWSGDLNGDGRNDWIVRREGDCGNWGECWMTVIIDSDQGPTKVAENYFFRLRVAASVTKVKGRSWRNLVVTERGGSAGDDRTGEVLWRYDGRGYVRVPSTRRSGGRQRRD